MSFGQHGSQQGEDGRYGDAEQENPLPAILSGKVTPRDLSEDVAIEEACQN